MIIAKSGTARSLATIQLPTPLHYDLEHFVHGTQCVFSKFMQDIIGNTALIKACRYGHVETAKVLLDHGANVEHQNNVSIKGFVSQMLSYLATSVLNPS